MTIQEAREKVDRAIYEFVERCGIDATDFDYSYINQELDDIVEMCGGFVEEIENENS